MPDLTQDESGRCPHCGAVLYWPPICCEKMIAEAEKGADEFARTVRSYAANAFGLEDGDA